MINNFILRTLNDDLNNYRAMTLEAKIKNAIKYRYRISNDIWRGDVTTCEDKIGQTIIDLQLLLKTEILIALPEI